MKKCYKCSEIKDLKEFCKHNGMSDGTTNICKKCFREYARVIYLDKLKNPEFHEKEKLRGRMKYHKLYSKTGKSNIVANKKYHLKYPEKQKANRKSQRLVKPFEGAEKHHWNYNEEYSKDVIWLTKKDHMKAHRFLVYDTDNFIYKTIDTYEILDTKEKHFTFITNCINNKED